MPAKKYFTDAERKQAQARADKKWRLSHVEENNRRLLEYRNTHKEERRKYGKEYYAQHPEERRAYYRNHVATWVEIIPPVCVDCGETAICFLELDHKNGDGNKHRKSRPGKYTSNRAWLVSHPEDAYLFEVRCVMCHAIKTANQTIARIKERSSEC